MNGDENPPQYLFEVTTPLDFSVRCTEEYWQLVSTVKHTYLGEHLQDILMTLTEPDEIRKSSQDEGIFVFYHPAEKINRWWCAVVRRLNGDGFLVTAYRTSQIKQGETVWKK
jgi:hypothetical protein